MASEIFTINYKQELNADASGNVTLIDELKLPKMHDMEGGKRIVTEILGYEVQWSGDYFGGAQPNSDISTAGLAGCLLLNPRTTAQLDAQLVQDSRVAVGGGGPGTALVVGLVDVIDTFAQQAVKQIFVSTGAKVVNQRPGSQGTIFRQMAPYGKGFDVLQDSIYIGLRQKNGYASQESMVGIRFYCRQRVVSAQALNAMVVARMQAD